MTRDAIPRFIDTAPGLLAVSTFFGVTFLWFFAPASQSVLTLMAPLLVAMLFATLAGSCLRITIDLITGRRITFEHHAAVKQLILMAVCIGLALMILRSGMAASAQADEVTTSLQVSLAWLAASSLSVLAFGAGLHYGDDATWRRERGIR